MGALLDPIGERLQPGGDDGGGLAGLLRGPARAAASALLSAEAGALTGYLSQRVLGQFEFVIVDPLAPARLLFVAPNIAAAAVRLEADPEELLTWIAFHEVTHAVQFTGGAVAAPAPRGPARGAARVARAEGRSARDAAHARAPTTSARRSRRVREGGLVAAIGGAQRRELLERIQSVMGVVEGHAEHVMDVVGARGAAVARRACARRSTAAATSARRSSRCSSGSSASTRSCASTRTASASATRVATAAGPGGAAQRLRRPRAAADGRRAARPGRVDAPHRHPRRRVARAARAARARAAPAGGPERRRVVRRRTGGLQTPVRVVVSGTRA